MEDHIARAIVGVYGNRDEAQRHPELTLQPTAWVVIKRLCDPGWDYLPRLAREVCGNVSLDEEDEEYVEAVVPNKLAAQLFIEEWDARYDWRNMNL